jgi:Domain of unknown function (DUF4395)
MRLSAARRFSRGDRLSSVTADGRTLHAPVYDETEVRAAAGLTMVVGAVAFAFAYFDEQYVPLQVVSAFFFVEFLARLTVGLRYSPVGLVARQLAASRPPEWVSAKPKHFAWTLGLALAFSMMVITNSGIRGLLPRTICLICLTLMWLESVMGICLGCELHARLVRRGWTTKDPAFEVCAGGVCELPVNEPADPAPVHTAV